MSTNMTTQEWKAEAERCDRIAAAKAQGQAKFDSIREMVEALEHAHNADTVYDHFDGEYHSLEQSIESAEQRILEDALSVEVRSGWETPGQFIVRGDPRTTRAPVRPAEYRILLCTGGPACQIVGELSEHGEPETAVMQVQDWFTPWTDFRPVVEGMDDVSNTDAYLAAIERRDSILLDYARCFYFGE